MPDVRDRIRHSRPAPDMLTPLDHADLGRRARRRDLVTRGAASVGVAAVLVGGVIGAAALRTPSVTINPGDVAASSDEATPAGDTSDTEPQQPSVANAVDALIDANETAPPHPVPTDSQVLVERTYALWGAAAQDDDGTWTTRLEATWYERRIDANHNVEIIRGELGTIQPSGDLAELRAQAQPYFEAGPSETPTLDGGESDGQAESALQEAERDSHGSAEPRPGATERPDQAHAFIRAADALRLGLQPQDRIRALQAIGRIDPSLVAHRGTQPDLLGRDGIAIAGRDPANGAETWKVLIFDPETGDLLGEYDEHINPDGTRTISSYTARDTLMYDTAN